MCILCCSVGWTSQGSFLSMFFHVGWKQLSWSGNDLLLCLGWPSIRHVVTQLKNSDIKGDIEMMYSTSKEILIYTASRCKFGEATEKSRAVYKNFQVTKPKFHWLLFVIHGTIVTNENRTRENWLLRDRCMVECHDCILYKFNTKTDKYYGAF